MSSLLHSMPTRIHVLSATLLSDEPIDAQDESSLRADASANGICYVTVSRPLDGGALLARVAAHPSLLPAMGYTVVLNSHDVSA